MECKVATQSMTKALMQNKSDSLSRCLGRLFFDIESMKRIGAPDEEIDDLRCVWLELLQEYRNIQRQLSPDV